MEKLKEKIKVPVQRGPARTTQSLEKRIKALITSYGLKELICYKLVELPHAAFDLDFWTDQGQLSHLTENWLGRRILITNRHNWSAEEIILAYWGQAQVEYTFKNLKNPYHLAFRPQYHWTDQKIEVHGFICFIALLLCMILYKRVLQGTFFKESLDNLLNKLSTIRLSTFIEMPEKKTKGSYKTTQQIEQIDDDILEVAKYLSLINEKFKTNIPFSVYN